MFARRRRREPSTSTSSSAGGEKMTKIQELVLPNAKLRFCQEQLHNLNYTFQKRLQEKNPSGIDKSLLLARSVTERLVQRLVCCVGTLDQRFSSKFLICSRNQLGDDVPSRNLEYMVRLDSLSTPSIYPTDPTPKYGILEKDADYPPAYARLRLHHASTLKMWSDCANSAGYLRRDKVQAKLVELLAKAASSDWPKSPLDVDESICCGTPGKIVSASTLHEILTIPPEEQLFYGPGGNVPRFPDPRDFRLAIVDEPGGIRLKVEFLSPALANMSIQVRILVAIASDSWPNSTDFPKRVTLGHTDCLLYHQAAQTGMYLVGYGVQSSAWQIRMPAAQEVIINHYGPNSTIRTILDVLFDILLSIDKIRKTTYKIINRYGILTMVLKTLEEDSRSPSTDLISWSPLYLSSHVLIILDRFVSCLRHQNLPNYFFRKSNLLVNPGHLCEEDYMIEAGNIKTYLLKLFDEALMSTKGVEDFRKISNSIECETILLYRWRELVDGLLPPLSTRGRRFSFSNISANRSQMIAHSEYTIRQLEYVGLLLENLLNVKQRVISNDPIGEVSENHPEEPLEDVIYLLVTIMDQARDKYLTETTNNQTIIKNRSKIRAQFNSNTAKLVESIRKDKDSIIKFDDDLALVKLVLKWLYKALDHNKRHLAPILRPFLSILFNSSHSISWHLDFIKQRMSREELESLGQFAKLINDGKITPAQGLIDAVNKNWSWAESMLKMVEKHTLRVVMVPAKGRVHRHILSLPSYQRKAEQQQQQETWKTLHQAVEGRKRQQRTLPATSNRNYFNTILDKKFRNKLGDDEEIPQHEILKNSSPLTLALEEAHRRGEHRGYGDILKSLQSMQKLNMFQQVASTLPAEERLEMLEMIHSMQTVGRSKRSTKLWSSTLPQSNRRARSVPSRCEKYTPFEESAGVSLKTGESSATVEEKVGENNNKRSSLIGSCRAARIREDSSILLFQDSFRIKTMLNKSESFKL